MSLCDASGEDASGPQIAGDVVAFVKGVDLYTAGGAGVDELTAAQIDAHVADAAEGIERMSLLPAVSVLQRICFCKNHG